MAHLRKGAVRPSLLLLLVASAPALAGSARFAESFLTVPGDVSSVAHADLDGDGRRDLVVSFRRGKEPRRKAALGIFWNGSSRWSAAPDLVIDAEAHKAAAFDLGELDGAPGEELVLATPDGVVALSFPGRSAPVKRVVGSDPTIFSERAGEEVRRLAFVHRLREGTHGVIVPGMSGLTVYEPREGGYVSSKVPLKPKSKVSYAGSRTSLSTGRDTVPSVSLSYTLPAVHVLDFNGDGLMDLGLRSRQEVSVILQRAEEPRFDGRIAFSREFDLATAEEKEQSDASVTVMLDDVDRDGFADALVRKELMEGFLSMRTTLYLFLGGPGGFPAQPTQTLAASGASVVDGALQDLDGDGKLDLLVPGVELSLWSVIGMLTTRSVSGKLRAHGFGPDRRFSQSPTTELDFTFKVDFDKELDPPALDGSGDYDGDKKPDLVLARDEDTLLVHRGFGERTEEVKTKAFGRAISADLDGDGRAELIFAYPSTPSRRSQVRVLGNVGPW